MNSQEIPEAGPLAQLLWNALGWLDPVVHAAGLILMAWAFWRSGKRGYLVVGCYFLMVLLSPLLMPAVREAMDRWSGPNLSAQTQAKMDVAIRQAVDRVLAEAGHSAMTAQRNVTIPAGPMLLVGGLWLVARREAWRDSEGEPAVEPK